MNLFNIDGDQGLSPRVRGSRHFQDRRRNESGSIPACAGEPKEDGFEKSHLTVYPRVCGGATFKKKRLPHRPGLSPRVRGSHGDPVAMSRPWRSIPACAGEPSTGSGLTRTTPVYPRVCGGALIADNSGDELWGLSPRVRGSLRGLPAQPPAPRSIPACAGEPWRRWLRWPRVRVYPRVPSDAVPY